MAFPQGIYFRAIDDQVDPDNYDAEIGQTANYPRSTAQGNQVGWEGAPTGTRDRGGAGAVELRGMHFVTGSTAKDYRIDLPSAGNYNIRLAIGDQTSSQSNLKVELVDGTTVFATPINQSTGLTAGFFVDATGVVRNSQANWSANNAVLAQTFASTIFRIRVGGFSAGGITPLAAVYIESASALLKYWSVPTSAANSTIRELVILSDDRVEVIDTVEATVTGGVFLALCSNQSQVTGTKRFAMLHNWDGTTTTLSIRGGPAIAEVIEV